MNRIGRRLAIGAGLLSAALLFTGTSSAKDIPSAKPESVGMSSERLALIRPALQREIDANRTPGAVVMIARKGKLVYSEAIGFQDKVAGKPMTRDAIFRIFSMTKPLTTVAAMMLVEEGRIVLNDPVSKYLPALEKMEVLVKDADGKLMREPAKRAMTVQDLMRHTAGLAYGEFTPIPEVRTAYAEAGLMLPGVLSLTPEKFVEGIAKVPLVHQPGTTWEYSMSVDVLGRVVEAVAGKRLGAFLDERLFGPLGMVDTGFAVSSSKWSRIAEALPTDPLTGKPNGPMLDIRLMPMNDQGGAGGASTAADYLRFCQMMLEGGSFDGKRYLGPATVRWMASDHLGARPSAYFTPGVQLMGVEGYTFGLGFMVRQGPGLAAVPGSEGEYSWAGAGGTFFWIDPREQLAVVYMAQTPGAIRPQFRRLIKQLVGQAIAK